MGEKKTRLSALTCQYAEKPRPVEDAATLESVPMSAANKKKFEILSEKDEHPFEFVQEVKFGDKYPATDETIFDKSWAESYAKKANEVPIPGSAYGHTAINAWKERVRNHLYVTAAKIDGDSLLLRHYVSNKMDPNDYSALISEIRSGLIATSVISLYEYKVVAEKDNHFVVHATNSIGRERNDLVEWDQTGMASKMIATSQKATIDENNEEGDKSMDLTYEQLIAALKDTMTKNRTDHLAVAKDLGLNIEVLTTAQKADLDLLARVRKSAGDADIEQVVSDAVTAQGASFITLRDAALEKEFGTDPDLKKSATGLFGITTGSQKDIAGEIDRLKSLDAIKIISAKNSDGRKKVVGAGSSGGNGEIRIGSNFKESK